MKRKIFTKTMKKLTLNVVILCLASNMFLQTAFQMKPGHVAPESSQDILGTEGVPVSTVAEQMEVDLQKAEKKDTTEEVEVAEGSTTDTEEECEVEVEVAEGLTADTEEECEVEVEVAEGSTADTERECEVKEEKHRCTFRVRQQGNLRRADGFSERQNRRTHEEIEADLKQQKEDATKEGDLKARAARLLEIAQEFRKLASTVGLVGEDVFFEVGGDEEVVKIKCYADALECADMAAQALLDQIDETTTDEQKVAIYNEVLGSCRRFDAVIQVLHSAGVEHMACTVHLTREMLYEWRDWDVDRYQMEEGMRLWCQCKESRAGDSLQSKVAKIYEALGDLRSGSGNDDEAIAAYQEAAKVYEKVIGDLGINSSRCNKKARELELKPQVAQLEKNLTELRTRAGQTTDAQELVTIWTQIYKCCSQLAGLYGCSVGVIDPFIGIPMVHMLRNPDERGLKYYKEAEEAERQIQAAKVRALVQELQDEFNQIQAEPDLNTRLNLLREFESDLNREINGFTYREYRSTYITDQYGYDSCRSLLSSCASAKKAVLTELGRQRVLSAEEREQGTAREQELQARFNQIMAEPDLRTRLMLLRNFQGNVARQMEAFRYSNQHGFDFCRGLISSCMRAQSQIKKQLGLK